jgi:hypothetical protein
MELSANADLISSSFIQDLDLFADSVKSIATAKNLGEFLAAVEMQLGKDNSKGGSILGQISSKMKSLISKSENYLKINSSNQELLSRAEEEAKKDLADIFSATKSIANYVDELAKEMVSRDVYTPLQKQIIAYLQTNSKSISDMLLQTAGSDPITVSIEKYFASVLDDKQPYNPSQKTTKAKSGVKISGKTSKNKLQASKTTIVTRPKPPVKNAFKVNSTKVNVKRIPRQALVSLPSLLNLLNSMLREQLERNMGSGSSTNILNYRTGRFAESVKVERLSESRQGMITAFYSYMKNPYATFSQGGRQAAPTSRDPRLLISKSIREIAQGMVTNKLRAVNV